MSYIKPWGYFFPQLFATPSSVYYVISVAALDRLWSDKYRTEVTLRSLLQRGVRTNHLGQNTCFLLLFFFFLSGGGEKSSSNTTNLRLSREKFSLKVAAT